MSSHSLIDVLIVGAGPAGLMCALGLSRAGVHVRIVDKLEFKVSVGQADGVQPRTMEVMQSYGLLERLLKEGNQMHTAAFYNPSPDGEGISLTCRTPDVLGAPTARYPFETTLHQGGIEDIFIDALKDEGILIERPVEPQSIQIDGDAASLRDPQSYSVTVSLKNVSSGQTELVKARFVIGADGAHSWVRNHLSIPMEGSQTEFTWGVVDFFPDTNFPDIRNRTAIHSRNGASMIIPREGGEKVRLYVQVMGGLEKQAIDPKTGRVDKMRIGPEKLLEMAATSLKPFKISNSRPIEWWTIYTIGQRVAEKFSQDCRVFITGDACHTHGPKAGQGMNASMNDAHNLIWKMTHVLRGWAAIPLLQTYEDERRKYAHDLIAFDKVWTDLFSKENVTHEEFIGALYSYGQFIHGIGIHYDPSAIVDASFQHLAKNVVIGERMPPQALIRAMDARPFDLQDLIIADMRFKLLIFCGDTSLVKYRKNLFDLANKMESSQIFKPEMFDIITINSSKKETFNMYDEIPQYLRPVWSNVFMDDTNQTKTAGGKLYENFGISSCGAVIVVRPDGYVGTISAVEDLETIRKYLGRVSSVAIS